MKLYLASLGAGLLVGIIYAIIDVRSPAPPIIALIGLLGILMGEQVPHLIKSFLQQKPAAHSWLHQVHPHMFGHLPTGRLSMGAQVAASHERMIGKSTTEEE